MTGGSFTSLTQREQGVVHVETQDVLLGAPVSVVKHPYAYFSKELGQQIDVSDVEHSTVFSSKLQSKQQQPAFTSQHSPTVL